VINIEKSNNCQEAQDSAVSKLQNALEDSDHPLLLLSGGSSVKVAIQLLKNSLGLNRWTIGQVDERYGKVGHQFSNWKALLEAGLEPQRFRQVIPILSDGLAIDKTAKVYEQQLRQALADSDKAVILLGVGADGHIAGMLPKERKEFETNFQGKNLVASFKGPDYERITITQSVLNSVDEIVAFSCGPGKAEAVKKLDDDLPLHEHPAQLLKYSRNVNIFTSGD